MVFSIRLKNGAIYNSTKIEMVGDSITFLDIARNNWFTFHCGVVVEIRIV